MQGNKTSKNQGERKEVKRVIVRKERNEIISKEEEQMEDDGINESVCKRLNRRKEHFLLRR